MKMPAQARGCQIQLGSRCRGLGALGQQPILFPAEPSPQPLKSSLARQSPHRDHSPYRVKGAMHRGHGVGINTLIHCLWIILMIVKF